MSICLILLLAAFTSARKPGLCDFGALILVRLLGLLRLLGVAVQSARPRALIFLRFSHSPDQCGTPGPLQFPRAPPDRPAPATHWLSDRKQSPARPSTRRLQPRSPGGLPREYWLPSAPIPAHA